VADLLITMWCPFTSLLPSGDFQGDYALPPVLCKLDVFYRVTCTVSSVLTLSAVAYDRFMAVIFPLRARLGERKARYFIFFNWIVSAAVASPFLKYRIVTEIQWADFVQVSCSETFPTYISWEAETNQFVHGHLAKKMFYSILMIMMFLVPVLMMTICYTLIIMKLYCYSTPGENISRSGPQAKVRQSVLKLVVVVMVIFVICWSPLQVFRAMGVFYTQYQLPDWVTENKFWIEIIAYSHAMVNPVIYVTFNKNFRSCLKKTLGYKKCITKCEVQQ